MLILKRVLNNAVFDRVEMNIVEVPFQVVVIPNDVIPEAVLPDSPGTESLPELGGIPDFETVHYGRDSLATCVDDGMKMVRKNYPGLWFFDRPAFPK